MASTKISDFDAAASLSDTALLLLAAEDTSNTKITGANLKTSVLSGTAATATLATTVTASANNTADATVYPTFVDGATGAQGIETDTGLTYNPNSGLLTAAGFSGPLTGNVTGNASGSAGSCTGNAATVTTNANLTGDVTSSGSNATAIASGVIVDDDVNGSAAIATSKLSGALTAVTSNGLGTAAALNTGTGASDLPDTNDIVGTQDMWIPAAAMRPRDNAGCAAIATVAAGTSGRPDFHVLDFANDADDHAQFMVAMPKSWDGGNITFSAYWIGLAATTGVAWGLQVKALGDGEDIDVAYGVAVVTTDDSQGSATEINVSPASLDIACSGAAGDLLFCQIFRDVSDGNDDMAGAARLVGIKINYTTDALNDA